MPTQQDRLDALLSAPDFLRHREKARGKDTPQGGSFARERAEQGAITGGPIGMLSTALLGLEGVGKLASSVAGTPSVMDGSSPMEGNLLARSAFGLAKGASGGSLGPAIGAATSILDGAPVGESIATANRNVNAASGLGGEVAGAILGVPGKIAVASTKLPGPIGSFLTRLTKNFWGNRAIEAVGGGAGALAYDGLSGGGDPLTSAGIASVLSPALGATGRAIGSATTAVGEFLRLSGGETRAAREMVEALRQNGADDLLIDIDGFKGIDGQKLGDLARGAELGGAVTIGDLAPDAVRGMSTAAMGQTNRHLIDAAAPLRTMLHNRSRMAEEGTIKQINHIFGAPTLIGQDSAHAMAAASRKSLEPQYTAAQIASNKRVTPVSELRSLVTNSFRTPAGLKVRTPSERALMENLLAVMGPASRQRAMPIQSGPNKGKFKKDLISFDPGSLLTIRKELDAMMSGNYANSDATSMDKAQLVQYIMPIRNKLNTILRARSPELAALDDKFGSVAANQNAYDAGFEALGNNLDGDAAFRQFMDTTDATQAERSNFLHGLKASLVGAMTDRSPEQLSKLLREDSREMKKLISVIPAQQVTSIRRVLAEHAAAKKAAELYTPTGVPGAVQPLSRIMDIAITAAGPTKYGSTAAGLGGARRSLRDVGQGGEATRTAAQADQLTMPATNLADHVNNLLRTANTPVATGGKLAGAGSILGSYLGGGSNVSPAMSLLDFPSEGE
jgi:hypothetical protein